MSEEIISTFPLLTVSGSAHKSFCTMKLNHPTLGIRWKIYYYDDTEGYSLKYWKVVDWLTGVSAYQHQQRWLFLACPTWAPPKIPSLWWNISFIIKPTYNSHGGGSSLHYFALLKMCFYGSAGSPGAHSHRGLRFTLQRGVLRDDCKSHILFVIADLMTMCQSDILPVNIASCHFHTHLSS